MITPPKIKYPKPPKATQTMNRVQNEQPVLAIDWDGVIHDRDNPLPGKKLGPPYPDAKESIEKLYNQGYRIVVHTCVAHTPAGYMAVLEWLNHYQIPHHEVTAVKPVAKLYIDDRALHHTDWNKTLTEIEERLNG